MSTANPMRSYKRYKGGRGRGTGRKFLTAVLVLVLVGLLAFCTLFGVVMAGNRDDVSGEPAIMVILGCRVMPSGQPSVLLRDRLDVALDYLVEHPDVTVIVTGGKGGDEPITEAQAMANYMIPYLTGRGFPEDRILLEEQSTSTYENILYSLEMIEEEKLDLSNGILIVSNGFHLSRVRMLWERISGETEKLSTLAAPASHLPSKLKMYIREPIAFAKSFLFDR